MGWIKNLLRKIFFFWRKEQSVSVIPKESEPELPVKKVEEVKVYHLEKTILTEILTEETIKKQVDFSGLPMGIYAVIFTNGDVVKVSRIVLY